MFNTYNPTTNNNMNINAVGGMLVKNHPDSFIVQCQFGSEIAKNLFNTSDPTFRYKKVVILQTLLCGDNRVMCEVVFKEDWDKPLTCGNAE